MINYFMKDLIKTESASIFKDSEIKNDNSLGVDFSFFLSDEAKNINMSTISQQEEQQPKRRRKKKDDTTTVATVLIDEQNTPMSSSEKPYIDSYSETNAMLRGAIAQTDLLSEQVSEDMNDIRNSKTMKNKYTYLTNMVGSAASLINTKVQAIREMDNNITQAHNLDLKRSKELKASTEADTNDDLKLMQMYDAFVNVPIGTYNPQGSPVSMQTITTMQNNDPNFVRVDMADDNAISGEYQNYINSLTPSENRARLEGNPNIKTVVMYNPEDGSRWFEVIDINTNQPIPNVEKPGDFLLADTTIDINNQVARNRNVDATWSLVIVGDRVITEY